MVQKAKKPEITEEQIPEINELVVTHAADWNKANTNERLIRLPGGDVFRVRDVNLPNMVAKGVVPLNITTRLLDAKKTFESDKKTNIDDATEGFKSIDEVCRKVTFLAVIEPIISEDENCSEDEIYVHDIDFADVMFIFTNCIKGGLESFSDFF